MRRTARLSALVILIVAAALAACTAAPPPAPAAPTAAAATAAAPAATTPAAALPATAAPTGAAAAAPANATAVAATGATAAAPATTPAGTPAAGPAGAPRAGALSGYTAQVEYKQEVVQPSPAVQNWVTMTVRYQGQPAPGIYAFDVADRLANQAQPGSGNMQIIAAGQDYYILTPQQNGKWLKAAAEQAGVASVFSNLLDPNKLAQDTPTEVFTAANIVNPHEQVGGVDTTHYQAKGAPLAAALANELGDSKLAGGQADYWVANRGSYIKQYLLDVTVQTADNRQIHELGRLSVGNENQPANIATPAADQVVSPDLFNQPAQEAPGATVLPSGARTSQAGAQALKAVPAPPNGRPAASADTSAAVRNALPAYTTQGLPGALYISSAKSADILAFYQAQLPKLGWQEVNTTPGTTIDQPAMGTFSKGQLTLQMVILPDTAKNASVVYLQVEG